MRGFATTVVAAGLLGALLAGPCPAQTSYLMITHTTPAAVQRGKTSEVTVEGRMNFAGVYKALFEGIGVTAEVIAAPANPPNKGIVQSTRLKVTVAPDAAPGVREFRLASPLGISSIGQLVVADDPVVQETGNNNTSEQANPIPVPCVVCGRIEAAEDVDYFKLHAEAGQVLSFEVLCARLEDKIHDLQKHADPMLTLYDAAGRELASNDDFYFADPLLTYVVPQAGDYYLQLRDSKYDGDPRWVYALVVTNRPYVTNVYPMAGSPGATIEVEPIGPARLKQPRVSFTVPKEPGLQEVRLDVGGVKTNPTAFIVSPLPQVLEQEPNDTPAQATRVGIPCCINGRVGTRGDLDHFVFAARKGQAVRFEVKARRFGTALRSSLDSVLDIVPAPVPGKPASTAVLATNDDAFGKDSALVFTPPADGDYVLRLRDVNNQGGDRAVYVVEADWARPDFTLRCDPDKAMIGPGSSTAWYVHVERANGFAAPVQVEVKGLPRGVTGSPLTIPPSMTQGVVVLTAAADAPRDVANVQVVGTATVSVPGAGEPETIRRVATPNEEIYSPGGGRARFDVGLQTVAVTGPSDILHVEVNPKAVVLKPGEEARIDVTIARRPDYTKGVSIDVPLQHLGSVMGNPLPPGVTVVEGRSRTLLGTGNTGHVVLRAATNAVPIDNVPISVLAHVSINFVVKVSYSSPPILVSVKK